MMYAFKIHETYCFFYIVFAQSVTIGTTIRRFMAVDDDLSDNGTISYSIMQISPIGSLFTINSVTGDFVVAAPVMINTNYQLQVTAMVC